jgi:hypothetical protein
VRFADNIRDGAAALDDFTPKLIAHADALDRAAASQLNLGQATADSLDMVTPKVAALGDTAASAADQTGAATSAGPPGAGVALPAGTPPPPGWVQNPDGTWSRQTAVLRPGGPSSPAVGTLGFGAGGQIGGGGAAGAPGAGGGPPPPGWHQNLDGTWSRDAPVLRPEGPTGPAVGTLGYGPGAEIGGGAQGAAGGRDPGGASTGGGPPGPGWHRNLDGTWTRDTPILRPQGPAGPAVGTVGLGAGGTINGGAGGGGQPSSPGGPGPGRWVQNPLDGSWSWQTDILRPQGPQGPAVGTLGYGAGGTIGGGSGGGASGGMRAAGKKDASGPTPGERAIVGAIQAQHETTKSLLAAVKSGPAVSWDTQSRAMGLSK